MWGRGEFREKIGGLCNTEHIRKGWFINCIILKIIGTVFGLPMTNVKGLYVKLLINSFLRNCHTLQLRHITKKLFVLFSQHTLCSYHLIKLS